MHNYLLFLVLNVLDSVTFKNLLNLAITKIVSLGERIIFAVIVYFVGRWVIKWLEKIVNRILERKSIDVTVVTFVNNTVDTLFKIVLGLIIVSILGLETTSFAAIIAAAGLAVGMAMKDNLSNFAGGVMILMNKPFRIGDSITAQGLTGTVNSIGILYTILNTSDNRTIYLPNGPLSTGVIINVTSQPLRRLDITLNINNGNDAEELKTILSGIISNQELVLETPTPFVGITQVNNGNFDVVMRVWVQTSNYSALNIQLNEQIYKTLSEKGIFTSSSITVKMAQ